MSDRLKIFDLEPKSVVNFVQTMLARTAIERPPKNDAILPMIVRLNNHIEFLGLEASLRSATPIGDFSHCWALVGGRGQTPVWKLSEESSREQHPRLVLPFSKGDKLQAYHLTFYAALLINAPDQGQPTDSRLAGEFTPAVALEQLELLKSVSRKNTASAKAQAECPVPVTTVAHICGNGFCVRPSHLRVVPKEINEEHTHCHWFQEKHCHDAGKVELSRQLCIHSPPCVLLKYDFK